MIKKFLNWFRTPSKNTGIGALLVIGGIGGIIFWGGFNTFMEYTNTQQFCTGCHEMSTVYEEYTHSIHYENNSGVQAICSDCHVPRPWVHKLARKIKATNEIYHKLVGSIDTPEKFEAKRKELANNVWRSMKNSNSRECRNCHDFNNMTVDTQRNDARFWHPMGMDEGFTCIDCHKGIAHQLPDLRGLMRDATEQFTSLMSSDSRSGNTLYVAKKAILLANQAAEATAMAEILPGAKIEVVERSETQLKVAVKGHEAQGDSMLLYSNRELAAPIAVTKAPLDYMDDATEDSATRISWRTASITGWINKDSVLSSIGPVWDYAKIVYENECARCHAVFAPSHFTANQWQYSMHNMLRFTELPQPDYELILGYLQHHSKSIKSF